MTVRHPALAACLLFGVAGSLAGCGSDAVVTRTTTTVTKQTSFVPPPAAPAPLPPPPAATTTTTEVQSVAPAAPSP